MGLVSCLGIGVRTVFDRMCSGHCGFRPITRFPAEPFAQRSAGVLDPDDEETLRDQASDTDLAGAMVRSAGREALTQARDAGLTVGPERTGLVLASNFGAMESVEWCWRERIDTGRFDADTYRTAVAVTAGESARFGIGGPRAQLSLSCATGAAALALAADWIERGRADAVLTVGYDVITEFVWAGLSNLRTITTGTLRPFAKGRDGTVFSEGAAAMVVARTGRWSGAGTAPLAVLAGAATNNNAYHMTAPPPEAAGSRRVMATALRHAGCAPTDVDHISAHGTGTGPNDVSEAAVFRNLFGERLQAMTVSAHKSQIGHMMGGAGLAEAIVTVMSMRTGLLPPTLNSADHDPACNLEPALSDRLRQRPAIRCAVTNSAGIGGNNAATVLQSPEFAKERAAS